ncbi:uncharacterized protein At2g29880-like [Magnolia sinica]|uniref:uncharacterized protein At2g29880-like n=1 Tax=Magnolia sinica TaxID=86752 RepID=UPI002657D9F0|nr:uncharacterized protein At2g29880-like [Magnolia sinica]
MSDMWSSPAATPTKSPIKTPTPPTRCSPRAKPARSLAEPSYRAQKIKWTNAMDEVMLNTLLEQIALGRKSDNGFKREAYQAAAEQVSNETHVCVNWSNVVNRMKYHKKCYNDVKDMLSASGFGWDNERKVVTAPDEVWEAYLKSHPRTERLRGKRIERMDDLAVIVGDDQATGRYAQGSKNLATSSSRVQRDLNQIWSDGDENLEDSVDLSEDNLGDSGMNSRFSNSQSRENQAGRSTPKRTPDSANKNGGSITSKRLRPTRPCDVLGMSLNHVAEAMSNFGLGEEVNRTTKVLDILEEVEGLTNAEFIEVGQILSRDKQLASFFVSLRVERRMEWLKHILHNSQKNVGDADP